MEKEKTVKKPSLGLALLPVVFLVVALVLVLNENFLGAEDSPHFALISGAIFAAFIANRLGFTWKQIEDRIISTISLSMQAILILMTVGALIGAFIIAGTVPTMIDYGLRIISPGLFLVTACLLCCIVSLAIGSSWSTAGTVGVALIGIAHGLGINPAIAAGAIVSGAYFGDKMSPLSETTNLAPAMAGSNLFDHIKHMLWTTGPALLIALALYGIIGMGHAGQSVDNAAVQGIFDAFGETFNISPLTLIPLFVIILIVVIKIPALPGLFIGIGSAALIAYITQWGHYDGFADMSAALIETMHFGFEAETGHEMVDSLINRGGLESMMWTVSLIMCAMCFGGIMEMSGCLEKIAETLLVYAKGTGSLVLVTIVSCLFINVLCADQYLAIVIPGRMYRKDYIRRGLDPKNLSRSLEDSGTLTSSLIPWNTCGAAMAGFLMVETFAYAPYAFLNLLCPIIGVILAFTGIGIAKLSDEDKARLLASE